MSDEEVFSRICSVLGAVEVQPTLERLGIVIERDDEGSSSDPSSMAELQELIGDCKRCGLCEGRKSIVFGVGRVRSPRLMIVGEAPGAEEDQRALPFVGPAGQMLNRMLDAVLGIARSDVFITNVVKCRPPGNRDPLPEEIDSCLPFLRIQKNLIRPPVVLLLGSVAVRATLGVLGGVKSHRGRMHDWEGTPCIATFHPSYLLRRPEEKPRALEDLLMLKDLLTRGVSETTPVEEVGSHGSR